MEAKDERFYTPRSSARRGVSSTGSEDERFVSPRESARSVSSDDNEYATPRESASSATEIVSHSSAAAGKPRYAEAKRDDYGKLEQKSRGKFASPASSRHAPPESARSPQLVAPPAPDNDIFSATRHNRIDSVTYMLDQGMSVNSRDEQGNTILLIACQNGLKRMAKLALRRGADIDAQNVRVAMPVKFCFVCHENLTWNVFDASSGATLRCTFASRTATATRWASTSFPKAPTRASPTTRAAAASTAWARPSPRASSSSRLSLNSSTLKSLSRGSLPLVLELFLQPDQKGEDSDDCHGLRACGVRGRARGARVAPAARAAASGRAGGAGRRQRRHGPGRG